MKKFILDDDGDDIDVEIKTPSYFTLTQVCEAFTAFLRASGYHFDGYVDIVSLDDFEKDNSVDDSVDDYMTENQLTLDLDDKIVLSVSPTILDKELHINTMYDMNQMYEQMK